ncbi:hypothetical protein G6F43_010655 [Rhizopus delemar]|nr:hypothetical protein G6F43_010655 [Rhizopus delemar]
MGFLSLKEVEKHNKKNDIWIIIHGKVYDLTNFLPEHPGGQKIILKYAGKDATDSFDPIHPPDIIQRLLPPDVFKGVVDPSALTKVLKVETEEDRRIRMARENMPNLDEMYNTFDFEAVAKSVLKAEAWSYFSSGSENEITLRENHSAFHRIWFKPRVMVNVKYVDPSTTFLGTRTAFPLYISATALGKMGHPEGEVVLARASAKRNLIQMISNYTSCSFDEIVDASTPSHTQWLQIYINSNPRREKDMRQKYILDAPEEIRSGTTEVRRDQGASQALSQFIDATFCWDDIAWIKSITKMPIVIKGVQASEDAVLAAKHGCQGIVISNHGGRQLDFAPSAIEILPEVTAALKRERINEEFEVYIDGGIRRGSDIFKAIALGAKGVGIGRPSLYAMSAYGDAGVERLLELLQNEFEMVMRLMGVTSIEQIKPEMVDTRNLKDHFASIPKDYLAGSVYDPMRPISHFSKL